ncbi:MAG: ATP cone domain-containing protein [Chloroflexota bacterium]|nr:ATP cone domain-containing protein [Chloroflexota bacterium]
MTKIESVVKRSGAVVPFNQDRITNAIYRAAVSVGGRDRSTAEGLSQQVVRILEEATSADQIPTVEDIQDIVEKVLIENGRAKVAKAYILYRDERSRRRRERAVRASRPSENIPWSKMWHVLDWAVSHNIHTIEAYNQRVAQGGLSDIIAVSEATYSEDVENAVEVIAERLSEIKIVIVTGPSSSGKTTTTIKLGERLLRMGYSLVTLNVDNYFFDLELHPRDEFGDYDFETPQALDLNLINQHMKQLIDGQEVQIPFYDFKTGKRHDERTPMRLRSDELLLIDSLHALYPDMMDGISLDQQFRLYLEPLLQMKTGDRNYVRWTDIRLMRRMLRDTAFRAYEPEKTLLHWHYVRTSELRNIIPYINSTDYIVNSAMPYELSIYRPKLLDMFSQWVTKYQDDPLREDAYRRARRVYKVLKAVAPLDDDGVVPDNSVLREFIGGSCYEY